MNIKKFNFHTEYHLVKWTGIRANNLKAFKDALEVVPGTSVFYHMHHAYFRRHHTTVNFLNDYAYWVKYSLNEKKLSEKLANINPFKYKRVRDMRADIIEILNRTIGDIEHFYTALPENAFQFCEVQSFVIPLEMRAGNLKEFYDDLQKAGMGSIFHHMVEARMRLENMDNDFSNWLEDSLGNKKLADKIRALPVYSVSLWHLKKDVLKLIKQELKRG